MATPHKASAGVGAVAAAGPSTFFQKERDRLIAEIADGTEQLLGNMNTLNRKLEESIAVGQEFEPISNLWGQFVDMMSSSGLTPQAATEAASAKTHTEAEGSSDPAAAAAPSSSSSGPDPHALGRSTSPNDETLPPGVAPGGGIVYGRD